MKFDIPTRIRELRMAQNLSTNKLSNMAGLSQSYVSKLESGQSHPTVESLELICDALGITFEDFITHSDASLSQLQAIKLIKRMNTEQLNAFCTLMEALPDVSE